MVVIEFIQSGISLLMGTAFVVMLVGYIYKRDAIHWEYLAEAYARDWRPPLVERWGHAVLYGKFPVSKGYNGIMKVGLHADGLSLRVVIPPKSFFCEPLFIPFKDIRGWKQVWYVNAKSVELELTKAPEVKIVMPKEQLEWFQENGGRAIRFDNVPTPNQAKPVFWYWILVLSSLLPISLIGVWWAN